MKRRSFVKSLLAMIPAALALPRIPKPAPDPEGIPIVGFNDQFFAPPEIIITRGAMDLEIGDPVYWDGKEGCFKKYPGDYPPEYRRVFGYVHSKSCDFQQCEISLGGIDEI